MIEIPSDEARRLRARAHLLGGSGLSPVAVVARAGALQGQDQSAVLQAIALRSAPGTTADDVRAAFDAGELVRGWPMRGTLFAVRPDDLAGFARATGPRMQAAVRGRRRFLGLEDADFELARSVAIEALDRRPHSREELAALWAEAGVPQGPGIVYHFTSTLAISGVLHLGRFEGGEQLVERARESVEDEAAFLARIARAFYAARGPATIDDLAWWTKLPKSVVRPAVEAVEGLEPVSVEGREMRVLDDGVVGAPVPREVVVPAFDEWILGYQDRSLVASDEVMKDIATVNGIFRSARIVDGVVVGRA
ncbi:MAG: hypothetical protein BGO95_09520 [Micrococcales bacterium 73-13]|nr:MAG: hypothetical protein BGO95_09520 [Micrococcales bacterium 73-13]